MVVRGGGAPEEDLAREEALLERAAHGETVLAWWSWRDPVVVLGYAQPEDDVDLPLCRSERIRVLRRITGGTGVVHHGDLALSLALPAGHPWARSVRVLYDRFLEALAAALGTLGVAVERPAPAPPRRLLERSPVCFLDRLADTLTVAGRKAVGCAQARRRAAVLVHGLVLLGLDPGLYARVFRVEREAVAAGLGAATQAGPEEVATAAAEALARTLGVPVREARLAPPPEALARYRDRRWAPV